MQAAKANVKLARLNLERTKIYSPFDALTTSDNVSIGSQINPQMILGNIVGIDRFFVEAFIPLDRLNGLKFLEVWLSLNLILVTFIMEK